MAGLMRPSAWFAVHGRALAGLVTLLAALVSACSQKNDAAPAAAGPGAAGPPPAEVGVVTVQPRAVGLVTELPGRLEASRVAQVRARAAGIVQKRLFSEGSDVKAGQPLFQIDAASYQTAVASAQATLARAQANLTQATAQAERYKPLVEANAISKQEYVNAVAAQKQRRQTSPPPAPRCAATRSTWAMPPVVAPISGRIGRALVTEGALVGQGEATPLGRHPAGPSDLRQLHAVDDRRARLAPGGRERQVQTPGRRRRLGGADRARGRHRLRPDRQAPLFRPQRRPDLGPDHAARRGAQPEGLPAPRDVRARAGRAGGSAERHRRSAAGGAARLQRRQRHGR
jgi:multidrug efflux pump subunit AcrA (membrane-fusion protein)